MGKEIHLLEASLKEKKLFLDSDKEVLEQAKKTFEKSKNKKSISAKELKGLEINLKNRERLFENSKKEFDIAEKLLSSKKNAL